MSAASISPEPESYAALAFDSIESTIEAFRAGEFIIVLDSQDRENEGDLIIAGDAVTADKMAFLVRYSRWVPAMTSSPPPPCRAAEQERILTTGSLPGV
ncbi:hypothetical protein KEM52_003973 [Ascosphaera acerosa]|nr:hypothetical protein KEM52_003973 [Ascosphaera acerosa]